MDISDVKKMTIIERIQAMELLWDSLLHENKNIDSPEWHRELLLKRKKRLDSEKLIPLSQVRKNLTK
jgi:hypothetical protein